MKMHSWEKALGSGLYSGYIPFASGTFGSLVAVIIYLIPGFEKGYILIPAIIIFMLLGIKVGYKFEKLYGKDPSQCTIDEVVGMWITLIFVPKTFINIALCFIIWRIFDIIKPYPARDAEQLPGGFGIMMDDVIASIYSLFVVHIIINFTKLISLF